MTPMSDLLESFFIYLFIFQQLNMLMFLLSRRFVHPVGAPQRAERGTGPPPRPSWHYVRLETFRLGLLPRSGRNAKCLFMTLRPLREVIFLQFPAVIRARSGSRSICEPPRNKLQAKPFLCLEMFLFSEPREGWACAARVLSFPGELFRRGMLPRWAVNVLLLNERQTPFP